MEVVAISISEQKGQPKHNLASGKLITDYGLEGDAHADGTHRQLSLLDIESIEEMRKQGFDVNPGDFAENITTKGITLCQLPVGTQILIGEEIELEVTQIGKECHSGCAIMKTAGKCIMPIRGIFCRILKGGIVKPGDGIKLMV